MVKKKPLVSKSTLFILAVFVGIFVGYYLGVSYHGYDEETIDIAKENHESHSHDHSTHSHSTIEVTSENKPQVEVVVHKDPKSGYNVEITTENFEFSPQRASTEHIEGEGHAHLFVNNEKISRIYSNWYYLSSLEKGHNEIRVTLNSNNHNDYTVSGEIVEATTMIMVE